MALKFKLCWVFVSLVALAAACRWDRDTLAEEARGKNLDVLKIIVGRFERNPPLYYQMRLDRVAKEIQSNRSDLNLYNDAAVACDHLGKFDEAIAWMKKQERAMANLSITKEAGYRFHANLGTFYAHRWFANKADLTMPQDLDKGIEHIHKAIAINPNAHFGREKFQLALMEWAKEPGSTWGDSNPTNSPITPYLEEKQLMRYGDAKAAVEGFAGLIRLGNAWESVDVFAALADALLHERLGAVGEAALARVLELQERGKRSMVSWKFDRKDFFEGRPMGIERDQAHEEFKRLRQEADAWHKARTDFMLARLQEGKHPDTDKDFWDGYKEANLEVKGIPFWKRPTNLVWATIATVLSGLGIGCIFLVRFIWRAFRPKPQVAHQTVAPLTSHQSDSAEN